jgi:pantoate--beta-alanine ligase
MNQISTIHTIIDLKQKLIDCGVGHRAIVPTMGNLHAGHLELVKNALDENDIIVVTIFVNPTQFAPHEDFNQYPRTIENDLNLLAKLFRQYRDDEKELIIFIPEADEIYNSQFSTQISVGNLKNLLEGEVRPTHFDGVATVVFILFSLCKPHRAYFGQKDWQQYLVIRQMVLDLKLDIEIIAHPIVRDQDGLALSSRNQYLSLDQRKLALILPQSLQQIATLIREDSSIVEAQNLIKQMIKSDSNWNYLAIKDAYTLADVDEKTKKFVIIAAYQLGHTRLLDNILLDL